MGTDRKHHRHRRQLRELFQHRCHALQRHILHRALNRVIFLQQHHGKPLGLPHFRRRQHHAPHTVHAADVDLMGLRHQHPHMDNIPHAMSRGIELRMMGKQLQPLGLSNGHLVISPIWLCSNSLQHGVSSSSCISTRAKARYSAAIWLSG